MKKNKDPELLEKKRGAGAEKKLAGSPALAKTIQKFANEYMSDLLVLSNDLKIENVITIAFCDQIKAIGPGNTKIAKECISGPLMTTNE